MSIEDIIEVIKDLPLKDALALLVLKKIYDYSKEGYEKIRKLIQDKYAEKKYAFVPNKKEAIQLLETKKDPNFRQILLLVPNYRYIDIIRTGLLIDYYHRNDSPENRKRVINIKNQIAYRPNGKKLLKIVNLPTTPFFSIILQFLYEMKKEGYSPSFLEESLEGLIEDWEKTSKLVTARNKKDDVVSFCKKQVEDKIILFCICGMRMQSKKVEAVLKVLEKDEYLKENGYTYRLTKSIEGNQPRTEIMFIKSS